jgi:hypothetical protein
MTNSDFSHPCANLLGARVSAVNLKSAVELSDRDCSPWIKRAGFQWLHRLIQDPKRLWKRYVRNNPAFLWHIAMQLLRFQKYPLGSETASAGSPYLARRP